MVTFILSNASQKSQGPILAGGEFLCMGWVEQVCTRHEYNLFDSRVYNFPFVLNLTNSPLPHSRVRNESQNPI